MKEKFHIQIFYRASENRETPGTIRVASYEIRDGCLITTGTDGEKIYFVLSAINRFVVNSFDSQDVENR